MKKSSNSVISAASAYKGHLAITKWRCAIALLTLINFAPLASADPGNIDDSYDGIENRDFLDDFGEDDFDARDSSRDDSGGYDVRRGGFGEINDVGVPIDNFGKDDFDARDSSRDDFLDDARFRKPLP